MAAGNRNELAAGYSDAFDPGLANERTSLAWNRTGLALAALGGALIRAAAELGGLAVVGYVSGGMIVVIAACVWAYGYFSYRRNVQARIGDWPPLARPLALKVIAIATTVAAAGAFALALLGT